jgi:hypothetical protein
MAVFKLTGLKEVIAKCYADLNIKEEQVPISDMITWGGEALRKIGGYASLVNRITGIADPYGITPVNVIKDYRTKLPCDLVSIVSVSLGNQENGSFIPAHIATGSYETRKGDIQESNPTILPPFPSAEIDKIQFISDLLSISYEDAVTKLDVDPQMRTIVDKVFVEDGTNITGIPKTYVTEAFYTINPPYLDTSLKDGFALIAYKAIPLDCDGYPMIPDDEDVKEAIYWYINMKMLYPLWRNGRVRDIIYQHSENEWKKKKMAAYSNIQMPSPDEMQTILNTLLRLIPTINAHDTSYQNLGQQEKVKSKQNQ